MLEKIAQTINRISQRQRDTHKGDYGTALIVAGSSQARGCAALAAYAALRSGVGKLILASYNSVIDSISLFVPEAVFLPCNKLRDIPDLLEFSSVSSIGIGPGIGVSWDTKEAVEYILSTAHMHNIPTVLDADALSLLKEEAFLFADKIITPHLGEFSRLVNLPLGEIKKDRQGLAKDYATKNRCILILKGNNTLVVSPSGDIFINPTGNPGMATAGSGDVLLGIITAFLSLIQDKFLSACCAVYVHGLAGDLAVQEKGQVSLIARDIIEFIPKAVLSIAQMRRQL